MILTGFSNDELERFADYAMDATLASAKRRPGLTHTACSKCGAPKTATKAAFCNPCAREAYHFYKNRRAQQVEL